MSDQKLSADPNSLIIGIVSVLLILGGCCCGLAVVPALGLAIYGLVLANKSLKEYAHYPESFNRQSAGNVKAAKIVNVVALILSGVATLVYMAYFIFFGAALSSGFLDGMNKTKYIDNPIFEEYDDSLDVGDIEELLPPVLQDNIEVDSIVPIEKIID